MKPGFGYNAADSMTYDGTLLDTTAGLAVADTAGRLNLSAAWKESLYVMLYAQVLAGSQAAARMVSPDDLRRAPAIAFGLMKQKLRTYLQINQTYPGVGGFLP